MIFTCDLANFTWHFHKGWKCLRSSKFSGYIYFSSVRCNSFNVWFWSYPIIFVSMVLITKFVMSFAFSNWLHFTVIWLNPAHTSHHQRAYQQAFWHHHHFSLHLACSFCHPVSFLLCLCVLYTTVLFPFSLFALFVESQSQISTARWSVYFISDAVVFSPLLLLSLFSLFYFDILYILI